MKTFPTVSQSRKRTSTANERCNALRERFATLPLATEVKQTSAPLLIMTHLYGDRYLHNAALETGF
ncbi:hypothetical protein T4B_11049 [Trichinella pseudospiralis]|uniref:Uncharacterized protein n=1 Tax=Trichinella pseudospiralis TaxID=6337 RepID=A0A0V1IAZ6_TRIPS|nr:hypothetical protein T4A_13702 [Trichinella pseudospiralis]KRY73420.1 hypothetical protein T4A_8774 [Trichinella pseudospiralis]KRZ20001.1 hypothetical protein T4B_11049 [Trichinella pseudospiralis]KRZ41784.1 hypothetical protein T4C_783 [Trichinella pseudospiralis]